MKLHILRSKVLICNSVSTYNQIVDILNINRKYVILYPPVNDSLIELRKGKVAKPVVVTIARIDPAKRLETIIEVARMVRRVRSDVRFLIIGRLHERYQSYYSWLIKKIKSSGLEDQVKILVNVKEDDKIKFLKEGMVFFYPPVLTKGVPIALLEAIVSGIIPIVYDEDGPAEIVPYSLRYKTVDEAAAKMLEILESHRVLDFSEFNYARFTKTFFKKAVKNIVAKMLEELD